MSYKQELIDKIQPQVNKLTEKLKKSGIAFLPSDGLQANVVFSNGNKSFKIAHDCFYRFTGIAYIYRDVGENFSEAVEVTDAMFMDMFMRSSVESFFK